MSNLSSRSGLHSGGSTTRTEALRLEWIDSGPRTPVKTSRSRDMSPRLESMSRPASTRSLCTYRTLSPNYDLHAPASRQAHRLKKRVTPAPDGAPAPSRGAYRPPIPRPKRQSCSPSKLTLKRNNSNAHSCSMIIASEVSQDSTPSLLIYKGQFSQGLIPEKLAPGNGYTSLPQSPVKLNQSLLNTSTQSSSNASIRRRLRKQNLSKGYRLTRTKLASKLDPYRP
jgi:hypothetical protein